MLKAKHIVILGAGISGLSAAWFLKQKYNSEVKITVLEEGLSCGGWIQTSREKGYLFEKGPRSFRTKNIGPATYRLLKDLDLASEMISAEPSASKRFIYIDKKLQALPLGLWKVPFSPLTQGWLKAIFNDVVHKSASDQDESIYDFFCRRLSPEWAERLIDPMVSGIFAGDIHRLSMKSSFPQIFELERKYGSLIKGALFGKKGKTQKNMELEGVDSSIFSFREGMKTLIESLVGRLQEHIILECNSSQLILNPDSVLIKMMDGTEIQADRLISAIPSYRLANLLRVNHPFLAADLDKINYSSVLTVNLGYRKQVLKQKGFGYLIPSKEKEPILGCVFDSCVFPGQNSAPDETRLTIMAGGAHHPEITDWSEEKALAVSLSSLERQLGLFSVPDYVSIGMAKQAIPQYEIGYSNLMSRIQEQISFITQGLTCIGPAFNGISVNDSIQGAFEAVERLDFGG